MKHLMRSLLAAGIVILCSTQHARSEVQNCDIDAVPPTIEGKVVTVEPEEGKLTVRAADGTIHEFQGSKETLHEYKSGDAIKASLRTPQECESK